MGEHRRTRSWSAVAALVAVAAALDALVVPVLTTAPATAAPGGTTTSAPTTTEPDTGPRGSSPGTTARPGATTTTAPVAADPGEPIDLPAATVAVPDDPRSAPELARVAVEGNLYDERVALHQQALDRQHDAEAAVATADRHRADAQQHQTDASNRYQARVAELADIAAARKAVTGDRASAQRRRDKAAERVEQLRGEMRDLAVNQYMAGGLGGAAESVLDVDNANHVGLKRVLISALHHDQLTDLERETRIRDDNDRLVADHDAELAELDRRQATAETARDQATRDRDAGVAEEQRAVDERGRADKVVAERVAEVTARRKDVADARFESKVAGLDMPFVVLNAYVLAARRLAAEQPACGIQWWGLAGIGKTESRHGSYGGSSVDGDGNETKPIYGPSLDGSNGTAVIRDTDGGALDGDPNGDRAAGPMQFIPQTWRAVAEDGNGDGKADPQNYYDATLTAGNYLCRQAPLTSDAGLRRAYRSYNNDSSYVEIVLGRAHDYSRYRFP